MDRLGIRELKAGLGPAVRRASAGERIVITVDGRPVAQLGPLEPLDGRPTIDDLAARGLVALPSRGDRPPSDLAVAVWAGIRLDQLVAELRR